MRKQLLVLPHDVVAGLLRGTVTIEWPEGWMSSRMDWNMPREALMIAVEADEFPEVEPGVEPPTIMLGTEYDAASGIRTIRFYVGDR